MWKNADKKGKPLSKTHRTNISKSLMGHRSWWKDKTFSKTHCDNLSKARRGRSLLELGHKKNCQCQFCKAKRGERTEKNHPGWKNDNAKYAAMHWWAKKYIPKPDRCPVCNEKRLLYLANRDHKYRRRLKDYKYLCGVCHKGYDKRMRQRNLVTLSIQLFMKTNNVNNTLETLNLQHELF